MFSLEPGAGDGMPQRTFAKPVEVQITGSILTYDISDPFGGKGEPVKSLAAQFPDLRRFIREGYVRYAFTRFGVPYVVSIQCLDSAPRAAALACREAYPVAERFLKALRVAGGLPSRPRMDIAAEIVERPLAAPPISPIARPATSSPSRIAQTGRPRRFHRLFANSISAGKGPGFRPLAILWKPQIERQAAEQAGWRTYSYPWQDNFCEARSFGVGQCASGFGHQGQDIRPAPCPPHSEGRRSLRSQPAGHRRRPRWRADPLA